MLNIDAHRSIVNRPDQQQTLHISRTTTQHQAPTTALIEHTAFCILPADLISPLS